MEGEAFRALQERELRRHLYRLEHGFVPGYFPRNRPTLAPTPRNDEDRGFTRSHENGVRVADILREVPHG